jgi:erythromycin esterase-like protein
MLDVVNWMRNYNIENPVKPLSFIGVDMQYYVETLEKMDEILVENKLPATDSNLYHQITMVNFFNVNEEEDLEIYKTISKNKNIDVNAILDEKSKMEYQILYRHLNQALEDKYKSKKDNSFRDRKMAENIYFHLQSDTTIKGFFWAHNGHILNFVSFKKRKQYGFTGGYLKQIIGDQYFCIGQDFDNGDFNAYYPDTNSTKIIKGEKYTLGSVSVPPAYSSSFSAKYRNLNKPVFIDCSTLPKKTVNIITYIGAVYFPKKYPTPESKIRYEPFKPSTFDAIILINKSTPTHLLD